MNGSVPLECVSLAEELLVWLLKKGESQTWLLAYYLFLVHFPIPWAYDQQELNSKGYCTIGKRDVCEKWSLTKITWRQKTNHSHGWHLQTGNRERFKERECVINCFCFFLSGYPTIQSSFPWTSVLSFISFSNMDMRPTIF